MNLSAEECDARVARAAAFCGIDETVLSRSPFELSGGQKRRAAIAGVLAMGTRRCSCSTNRLRGWATRGREEILGGLMEYQKQRQSTMLIISHSMEDIAKYADSILVLKNGKIFLFGTVGEVFADAQKLFDSSLDLPQITKLFVELQKRGLADRTDVYTVGYAVKTAAKLAENAAKEL